MVAPASNLQFYSGGSKISPLFFYRGIMEKKTIYKYKNEESYKSNDEYRVVTFINGNQDIMQIIKELIKNKIT